MPSKTPPDRQAGIRIKIDIHGLEQIREKFQQLKPSMSARYMAAGIKRAVEAGGAVQALKDWTPRGPTGNLKRSVAVKSKSYPRQGVGIAILGYKSGRKLNEPFDKTKLGYHQGLVEFGTKERYRRTKDGRAVSTGKMPIGGSYGKPPIRTAWERTRSAVESNMLAELAKAFDNAVKDLAYQVKALQGPY